MRDYIRVVVFKFNKKAGDYNGVLVCFWCLGWRWKKEKETKNYSTVPGT